MPTGVEYAMGDPGDEKLEQLLALASRRPVPDEDAKSRAHAAVRAEWREVSGRIRKRRTSVRFAIAATVLVAAFLAFLTFRPAPGEAVTVATIDRSFGSIYIVGQESSVSPAENLSVIVSGQTILTGQHSGLALAWDGGGSLRIDENSEIGFVSASEIELRRGRIYFDSKPASLLTNTTANLGSALRVSTEIGTVEHNGTQFMVIVDRRHLYVAVREGEVSVSGRGFNDTVTSGELADIAANSKPTKSDIKSYGDRWSWVAATSPAINVNGRPIDEFLAWAGRELGLTVNYETPQLENDARTQTLVGTIDVPPRQALERWMSTTGQEWRIQGGVIYVSTGD